MARPGRQPKGTRSQITLRVPDTHADRYKQEAADAGLPLIDYLAVVLADAHGLPEPAYVSRSRGQAELDVVA